ncbi:uncharacterized protein TNCV_4385621 [Trichonephila clavipes]|nr:uncharacterized protein TNCV_4385621 [Trichonephila clavipes]
MGEFTFVENAHMHYMYGRTNGNGKAALRMYHVQFPDRRMPNHKIFQLLQRSHLQRLSFYVTKYDAGRRRPVRSPRLEESVLNVLADRPEFGTKSCCSSRKWVRVSEEDDKSVGRGQQLQTKNIAKIRDTFEFLLTSVIKLITHTNYIEVLKRQKGPELASDGWMLHQATRGLLPTDHVILNHGQVTYTTPELEPPLLTTTPHQREDVSALDRFNGHRCPTRMVFSVGDRLTNTFSKDFWVRITNTFKKDFLCLNNEHILGGDEILTTARDLELEVNEDDIEELMMGHEDELTMEELHEVLNEDTKKHSEMCLLLNKRKTKEDKCRHICH